MKKIVFWMAGALTAVLLGLPMMKLFAGKPLENGAIVTVSAEDIQTAGENRAAIKAEPARFETKISIPMYLYKGDTTNIGLNLTPGDSYDLSSTDPEVASISKAGKIKAKKAGKARIKIVITKKKKTVTSVIRVRVRDSSYASTASYGNGISRMDVIKGAGTVIHREVQEGGTFQIQTWADKDARISFVSTNPEVAKVSADGTITAKKTGSCSIKVHMEGKKQQSNYRLVLHVKKPAVLEVTNEQQDAFYKDAMMSGNSIGVGLKSYCGRQYDGFLGNAEHFSNGSYSIMNDRAAITSRSLHPKYKGVKYRVKDAVKAMGAKRVCLSYGMNDLGIYGVYGAADQYRKFIEEIQTANPGVEVYIVSMTPVRKAKGRLNNSNIKTFNSEMKKYAQTAKDVYFIDIYSDCVDRAGLLKASYCSDNYCHLTNQAYELWTNKLKAFAAEQIKKRTYAKDAVDTAVESCLKEDWEKAEKLVDKLDESARKDSYQEKLEKIKGKLHD